MIKIAVISDIHFGKFSRTSEFSVPGEALLDENRGAVSLKDGLVSILKKQQVQYLFIAGDLTSIASPQEFCYCEKQILSIAEQCEIPISNILCCLGNHDIDQKITRICDEVIREDTVKEVAQIIREKYNLIAANCATSNLEIIGKNYKNLGPVPFSSVYLSDKIIVFLLNSGWRCVHDQEYSHGKIEEAQLGWFKEQAVTYREDPRIKILLMHHHPFKYSYPIPSPDISVLEEGSEIMDIVRDNGINIVIHGHRHHPIAHTMQLGSGTKPVTLICAGSLSVNSTHRNGGDIPNTFHILEIDDKCNLYTLYNYEYSSVEGWKRLEYSNVIPMDYQMKLGKTFSNEEIEAAILRMASQAGELISWSNLEECLKYITYGELTNRVKAMLSPAFKVVGSFPEDIVLLEK